MKIVVLGPAHPYRGGLASILETLARLFQRRGNQVRILTFTVQYPHLLFPGKSQTVETPVPAPFCHPGRGEKAPVDAIPIIRAVNTVNPLNWIRVGLRLRREQPDLLLLKYWTPFMAPCFGTIARLARPNKRTKIICQIDNVEPHEPHGFDKPLNRYFLRSVDGFIYMSEQVHRELEAYTSAPALFSPHPLFEQFGAPADPHDPAARALAREEACTALSLDPACRYALFFGLIRDYKGLDLLLDAWKIYKEQVSIAKGQSPTKLIVAGEFYTSKEKYERQIIENDLQNDVILHDHFIPDDRVKNYFTAADFLVQPYKTATQSGVTQIAYQFDLPMIVTDVGGLPEIVPDGTTGLVVAPDPAAIAHAIQKIWHGRSEKSEKSGPDPATGEAGDLLKKFRANMPAEKRRFSWDAMCDRITELYDLIKERGR